jgi:putative oxidoreductase
MRFFCDLSKSYAPLLGRILLAFIFLQSAFDKVLHYDKALGLMGAKGIGEPQVLLPMAIAALFIGGIMVLVGWKARWGALLLIAFMIPATLYFHDYWAYPEAQQLNQFHHFVKNAAIIGALLMILGMGSGALSVDGDEDAHLS